MKKIIQSKAFLFVINLITALSFTYFTFYQLYMLIMIPTSRSGRVVGIILYLCITVAAFFVFINNYGIRFARFALLVGGLGFLFIVKLFNLPVLLKAFSFSNIPSMLTFAVYVFSQLSAVIMIVGYLILRSSMEQAKKEKVVMILMLIAIGMYVVCFAMECVMMLVYHMNIDLRLRYTLIWRTLFYLGFISMAIGFMIPAPKPKRKHKEGKYLYSEDEDVELIM